MWIIEHTNGERIIVSSWAELQEIIRSHGSQIRGVWPHKEG